MWGEVLGRAAVRRPTGAHAFLVGTEIGRRQRRRFLRACKWVSWWWVGPPRACKGTLLGQAEVKCLRWGCDSIGVRGTAAAGSSTSLRARGAAGHVRGTRVGKCLWERQRGLHRTPNIIFTKRTSTISTTNNKIDLP